MDQGTSQTDAETLFEPSPEHFSWDYRLQYIAMFAGFYAAIFLFSHIVSSLLSATYKSLPAKEKVQWNSSVVRLVNASQSVIAGLQVFTADSQLLKDKVAGQNDWSRNHLLRITGFYVYDNLAYNAFFLAFQTFDLSIIAHHVFTLMICLGALACTSLGHFLPVVTPLLEISTLFKNLSWFIHKAGWTHTKLWRVNQWMIIHMYHCRMLVIYYINYFFCVHWAELESHITLVPLVLFFSGIGLLIFYLNPKWVHGFTMQYIKALEEVEEVNGLKNGHAGKSHAN